MVVEYEQIREVEGELSWVTYAKRLVNERNNCLNLVVVGGPGSGKSWSLLSFFSMLDPDFDVNEQCVFHARKLIEYFRNDRIVKGKPIMYDEAGVDLTASKWQNEVNLAAMHFFQTSRYLNYWFGATTPFLSNISKGVRKLMTARFTARGWSNNETKILPRTMQYNDEKDMFYYKRLFVTSKNPHLNDFTNVMYLPRPPKKIRIQYEKLKKEFTIQLYDKLGMSMDKLSKKDMPPTLYKCIDVGRELCVSKPTMIDWIKRKRIEARRIGRHWYMTPEERIRLLKGENA